MVYQQRHNLNTSGFTLIELLVVVIIIGVLSAIALPSFLNQSNSAKASEAKVNINALIKGQQLYNTAKSEFTEDWSDIEVEVDKSTENYKYSLKLLPEIGSSEAVGILATPRNKKVKAHLGIVETSVSESGKITSQSIICESIKPGKDGLGETELTETRKVKLECSSKSKRVS